MSDPVADAVRVSIGPKQIAVDFGRRRAPESGAELAVELSDRVLMPPATARRLVVALRDFVRDFESKCAPAGSSERSLEALLDPTRGLASSRAEPHRRAEGAQRLFGLVAGLGVDYLHERSFRMRPGALHVNRFLLTVGRRALGATSQSRMLELCHRLEMPRAFLETAAAELPKARCFHFGYEGDESRRLFKFYIEMDTRAEVARGRRGPILLHLAFKWDDVDPARRAVSRYHLYPSLSAIELLDRLSGIYAERAKGESCQIAREVASLAAERMRAEEIEYLEVEEEGTPRRSFDLNLYGARLCVRDLAGALARMRRAYGIPPGHFQLLYDQIKARSAGHLAGGMHRDGGDFFNVYYGIEGRRD